MSKTTREQRRRYKVTWDARPENRAKRAQWNKNWIAKNRDRYNLTKSKYRYQLKLAAIEHYSGSTMKCAQCGFGEIDALCLDHINNDGAEHRRQLKCGARNSQAGTTMYERLKALGWLPGLQVLCANCNTIKAVRLRRKFNGSAQ